MIIINQELYKRGKMTTQSPIAVHSANPVRIKKKKKKKNKSRSKLILFVLSAVDDVLLLEISVSHARCLI